MEYIEKLEKQHLRCSLCQPGKKELNISENGDVYPCAPLSNLENLFMGNDVNLFCHSCINFTLGMQSDEEIFQKFCEKQKGHLEKLLWGN